MRQFHKLFTLSQTVLTSNFALSLPCHSSRRDAHQLSPAFKRFYQSVIRSLLSDYISRVESCHMQISGREPNFACWNKGIFHLIPYTNSYTFNNISSFYLFSIFLMNHLSTIDEGIGIAFVAAPWLEAAKLPTIPDPGTQFGFFYFIETFYGRKT